MILRPYQSKAVIDITAAWNEGYKNVCYVAATGAGKTVIIGAIMNGIDAPMLAIAHRVELILQLSSKLASLGIWHNIIAPRSTRMECVRANAKKYEKGFISSKAHVHVGSVQTVSRRELPQADYWITDEVAHLTARNQWGKVLSEYPNARGLGVTATPQRADGQGLGRHASGIIDKLIVGPEPRWLIEAGYLVPYRIFVPACDIDFNNIKHSANGDFNQIELAAVTHSSKRLVGSVVSEYQRLAAGKRGVTFAVDVAAANELASAYRAAGIPAAAISAKTPGPQRQALLDDFRKGDILQLCNVDILGEGLDIPAIEVLSCARRTDSLSVYLQQIGRGLRPSPGKTELIIIDHVGNVSNPAFGLPDAPRQWSLDGWVRRKKEVAINPIKICPACTAAYNRAFGRVCPQCDHYDEIRVRTAPEQVDGDLVELDARSMNEIIKSINHVGKSPYPYNATPIIKASIDVHNRKHVLAQAELRQAMLDWSVGSGISDDVRIAQRQFFIEFGIDVLSAQGIKLCEMKKLIDKIVNKEL